MHAGPARRDGPLLSLRHGAYSVGRFSSVGRKPVGEQRQRQRLSGVPPPAHQLRDEDAPATFARRRRDALRVPRRSVGAGPCPKS